VTTVDQHVDSVLSRDAIETFLSHEARLMDERRLREWLALWTGDCRYWVPTESDAFDLGRVQLILDDHERLEERVHRLTHADAHAQEPPSRTTHLITSVEIEAAAGDEVQAHAAVLIVEVRHGLQEVYAGRATYRLRQVQGQLKLVEKRVALTRGDAALGNVTFLV